MIGAKCIRFSNRAGMTLHGILHEPDPRQARGVCLLLLSPGIKGRVGPHRLYRKIAQRLVPLGFHVLRFDFHGLGDSEGEIDERVLSDMYNTIQDGRYVHDTIAAMDWMMANFGIRNFIGSGLCGGSITAMLAAAVDSRIVSMLALSIPTAFDGGEENWARYATSRQLAGIRRNYFRRIVSPKSWVRLLTGRTNYRILFRSMSNTIPRSAKAPVGVEPASMPAQRVAPPDDTNPKFAPAFLKFVGSKRRMLLIFSSTDRVQWDFEEKFQDRYRSQLEPLREYFEVKSILSANHTLSDRAWVGEMLDKAIDWLDRTHPSQLLSSCQADSGSRLVTRTVKA